MNVKTMTDKERSILIADLEKSMSECQRAATIYFLFENITKKEIKRKIAEGLAKRAEL